MAGKRFTHVPAPPGGWPANSPERQNAIDRVREFLRPVPMKHTNPPLIGKAVERDRKTGASRIRKAVEVDTESETA